MLVLRPGALGDTLLAVPALRAIRAGYPDAQVQLAAHGAAARLLQSCGEVDTGLAFDDVRLAWLFGGGTAVELPDLVVAWMEDPAGILRARLAALGVDAWLAPSRPADGTEIHCARHLWEALRLPGTVAWNEDPIRVAARASDEVLVHPGSGAARKNWPPEKLAEVVRLVSQAGKRVRLIVGEADERAAEAVERAYGSPQPRLQAPLDELAAALGGCAAYLGNDSGVSHLAGLVGAHVVALFGPTPWQVWHPLGPHVRVVPFEAAPREVAAAVLGGARLSE